MKHSMKLSLAAAFSAGLSAQSFDLLSVFFEHQRTPVVGPFTIGPSPKL